MSRVYFHSPSRSGWQGASSISGSERAHMAGMVTDVAHAVWRLNDLASCALACTLFPPEHPVQQMLLLAQREHDKHWRDYDAQPLASLQQRLHTWLGRSSDEQLTLPGGHRKAVTDINLNTALAVGGPVLQLAAYIDGWCEIHAWVDGPDREWLASIISGGLDRGIFRRGLFRQTHPDGPRNQWVEQGWDEVLEHLLARADEPVVMSYSVCCSFPCSEHSAWPHAAGLWAGQNDRKQWQLGMDWLRGRGWGQLSPDTLGEVKFGPPVTVYDLLAPDADERVRAAYAHLEGAHAS